MEKSMKKLWAVCLFGIACLVFMLVRKCDFSAQAATGSTYKESYGSELSTRQKEIYDALVSQYYNTNTKLAKDAKGSSVTCEFSNPITYSATFKDEKHVEDAAYEQVNTSLSRDVSYAYWAFVYDYPEVYWVDSPSYGASEKYSYDRTTGKGTGTIASVTLTVTAYGNSEEIATYNGKVKSAVQSIQSSLTGNTRYEKVKAIHDWVCKKASYNNYAAAVGDASVAYAYSSGNVFVGDGKVVCEGYAKTLKVLCDQFDIPAALVAGTGVTQQPSSSSQTNENHMWVYVQMEDGKWYGVDPTWDDQTVLQDVYLLAGKNTAGFTNTFAKEHVERTAFSADSTITYVYPKLNDTEYKGKTLTAPTTVTAKNALNGVEVSWSKVSGATGYIISRKTASGKWTQISRVSGTTYSYVDKSAASGTSYFYRVAGDSNDAKGNYRATSKSSIYLAAPSLTVSKVDSGLKVQCGGVTGASQYQLDRKEAGGSWQKIKTVNQSGGWYLTDGSAVSGKSYYYRVKAYGNGTSSVYKETTSAAKYLSIPTVKKVENVSTGVKVTWNKVSGASGYYVYRKTGSEGWKNIATIKSGSTTSYTNTTSGTYKAVSGKTYYYTVRAYNGSDRSAYKSSSSIVYLAVPTVKAANVTNGVKVTWNKISGAKGYYVYRKTGSEGWKNIATIKSGSTTSYTNTTSGTYKAVSGTTYYYTVRAYSGSTRGQYKSSSAIKYLATPTVKVAKASNGIKASWNKVTGASGYYVYRKTANGEWSPITTVSSKTTSYVDKTAKKGVTYYYTVRAYSKSGSTTYKGMYKSSSKIKR